MKSSEDIQRRIEDVQNSPWTFEKDIEIDYLKMALDKVPEYWLEHLLRKYEFETVENNAIIKTLKWVLDKEDEI